MASAQTWGEYFKVANREQAKARMAATFGDDQDAVTPKSVLRARLEMMERGIAQTARTTTTTTAGRVVLSEKTTTLRGRPCKVSRVRLDGRTVEEREYLDAATQYARGQK